jgi:hypothetical protein
MLSCMPCAQMLLTSGTCIHEVRGRIGCFDCRAYLRRSAAVRPGTRVALAWTCLITSHRLSGCAGGMLVHGLSVLMVAHVVCTLSIAGRPTGSLAKARRRHSLSDVVSWALVGLSRRSRGVVAYGDEVVRGVDLALIELYPLCLSRGPRSRRQGSTLLYSSARQLLRGPTNPRVCFSRQSMARRIQLYAETVSQRTHILQ